jgi:hypothetical protein
VSEVSNYLNEVLKLTYNNNEGFIVAVAKDAKALNARLLEMKNRNAIFDFETEIEEIKGFAERQYNDINKLSYFKELDSKLANDLNSILDSRSRRVDQTNQSLNFTHTKGKRMLSFAMNNKTECNIDIDIFVRDLANLINTVRVDPQQGLFYLDQYVTANEEILSDTQISQKVQELAVYLQHQHAVGPLEWDNDLSNSAEDYLKKTHGKLESYNQLKERMKSIIGGYYEHHGNVNVVTYNGTPNSTKILLYILLNQDVNFIFSEAFNQIGICAVDSPTKKNAIVLIINLSNLNK